LTPNDTYMSRTAPLTSKRCILYIYSTNVGTEYFKHVLYSLFFFSSKCSLFHNANFFGSCIIHILYTGCAEFKKKKSGAKGLRNCYRSYLFKGQTRISLLKKFIDQQMCENLANVEENRVVHSILIGKSKGKNHL